MDRCLWQAVILAPKTYWSPLTPPQFSRAGAAWFYQLRSRKRSPRPDDMVQRWLSRAAWRARYLNDPVATRTHLARAETDPTAGNVLGMPFVGVPVGSFQMGSNDGDKDEKPVHTVRITKPFWTGKYEVTQEEYEKLAGKNPSRLKGAGNPVEYVSWNGAVAFCKKLTERERSAGRLPAGYEYRLPTEAEWEYVARGGAKGREFTYSGSNDLDDVGWHSGNSGKKAHPVGAKRSNELGIHDMSGNVWEWHLDWYGKDTYSGGMRTDPRGPQSGLDRVYRGGSWFLGASFCRVAFRDGAVPSGSYRNLGFRVALGPSSNRWTDVPR